MRRTLSLALMSIGFIAAGALHFARPRTYEKIVPPYLPAPRALVYLSGAAEIAGGIGVLVPATRTAAGWGLVALMIAVFPANVYMAAEAERFARVAPPLALYARLPLQAILIAWVHLTCKPPR
ncbi:MAG: DoxX family protein [Vulcanimicrobiaceae bacterium]